MVNKRLVIISYLCTFLFIYLCVMAYAIIPTALNKEFNMNIDLPKNQAVNETITAVSEINSNSLIIIRAPADQ